MDLSPNFLARIEIGDIDAVEEAWIAHSAEHPEDAETFAGVARALERHDQEDTARFLLELHDESLRESGRWRARLELLRRAGPLLLGEDAVHPAILDTLQQLHPGRPTFQGLAEAVGLFRGTGDLPKIWTKVERLEGLLQRDVGTVVGMAGQGVGRVVEANLELASFKVDFGGRVPLTVGFRAAEKLLQLLPDGHVLRRRLAEPEELLRLRNEDPSELLHSVLRSYDRPLDAGEVREALGDVVPESKWTTWWNAARKHPQVVVQRKGGKHRYGWAESSGHAVEAVWETFEAAEPRRQIDLLRREGERTPELRTRMARKLAGKGAALARRDPGLALEIRLALEGEDGLDEAWSVETLLAADPVAVFEAVESRTAREALLERIVRHLQGWPEILLQILSRESEARVLDRGLALLEKEAPDAAVRFVDELLAAARSRPEPFAWLVERAATDEALRERWPLRLLRQHVAALDLPTFQGVRARLEAQCETGGTLPRLLSLLDETEATSALDALQRCRSLADYIRRPLITAIELRFPQLQAEEENQLLYALPHSIQARREELRNLLEVEIPANRQAIEEARALGDLRENFEYKSARQRHEYLNSRVAALNGQLERARPLDLRRIAPNEVRIGTTVTLSRASGEPHLLTILGPWESDPDGGVLSYESELGARLLGLGPGDEIELDGVGYRVESVARYGDG